MRLDKYVYKLPNGAADLFNNTYQYPAPFDTDGVMIAKKAVRDFGGLKINPGIEKLPLATVQEFIAEELTLNRFELAALEKMNAALLVDDETPDKTEVRTYGQATITNNIGARSTSNNLGATNGTTTNTDTSYETVVGKTTTTSNTTTNAVSNSTSMAAATDSTTSGTHTDRIEHFNNVGEDDAPDYIAKWAKLVKSPVLISYEKMIVDALTVPYYEEG